MNGLLDRTTLLRLLSELGTRLDAQGVSVEIYVVGGTAMMLAYNRERLTRDIDATWITTSSKETDVLEAVVDQMARDHGLPRDWLNDRVRSMLPRMHDPEQIEALSVPGLKVTVASPRHLLAMKARAARDARDLDDIVALCELLGLSSVEDVLATADDVWGSGMLRDETIFALRTGLAERGLDAQRGLDE